MGPGQDHRRRPRDAPRAGVQRLTRVTVAPARLERWLANFEARHGAAVLTVRDGTLRAVADDGSTVVVRLPFDRAYGGPADPAALVEAAAPPVAWGVLLVRRGGFAVALLSGRALVDHKVGQRHVQGRTKAGGQSQQRFARRRDNQARAAFEAAADHAARILGGTDVEILVTGGDRPAVEAVLSDPRLAEVAIRRTSAWLAVPDPRRAVLDQAVDDAQALVLDVENA